MEAPVACLVASIAVLACGCGPERADDDDVYPRNCGVEGPVDLFDATVGTALDVRRAGDYYLIQHLIDATTLSYWAVDRCGEQRVRLDTIEHGSATRIGVAGDHILRCNEDTGAVDWIDPTGQEPPRPLFPSAAECRVVAVGSGLATQEFQGGSVWFRGDPADPQEQPITITQTARPIDPDLISCWGLELDCESDHPFGTDIRPAGDELLVTLDDQRLLAFATRSRESRILDPGPVQQLEVLADDRNIVVSRDLGPTLVIDRTTGSSFDSCCLGGFEPIQQFGDWLVKGSFGAPTIPEPPEWTNFRAHHLPTGTRSEVLGRDDWSPFALLSADTVLADIRPSDDHDAVARYVVWPATGEREPIDLPSELTWTVPGRDGVFGSDYEGSEGVAMQLLYVGGPGEPVRLLRDNVSVAFPTQRGRIVFRRPLHDGDRSTPLWVMLPDESVVQLESRVLSVFDVSYWGGRWPVDRDEVLYGIDNGGGWVLRRTVLP